MHCTVQFFARDGRRGRKRFGVMAYELGQLCEIAFGERFALAVLEFEVGEVPVGVADERVEDHHRRMAFELLDAP